MNRFTAQSILVVAGLVGGVSLAGFAVFLFAGPISPIDMGRDDISRLVFDGLLCFGFFILHSGMIRKSFLRRLARFIPEFYHGAIYTVVSGITLLAFLSRGARSGRRIR